MVYICRYDNTDLKKLYCAHTNADFMDVCTIKIMQRVIKNHLAFTVVLIASVVATMVAIICTEQMIGLHELLGRIGGIELCIFGLIFTGLSTFLTTQYFHKKESSQYKLIEQHLGSVGFFYPIIVCMLILNYGTDLTGSLQEAYFLILLFCIIVMIITNFITLYVKNGNENTSAI